MLKNPPSKEESGNKDGDYGISVPGEEIGIQVKDDFDKLAAATDSLDTVNGTTGSSGKVTDTTSSLVIVTTLLALIHFG